MFFKVGKTYINENTKDEFFVKKVHENVAIGNIRDKKGNMIEYDYVMNDIADGIPNRWKEKNDGKKEKEQL